MLKGVVNLDRIVLGTAKEAVDYDIFGGFPEMRTVSTRLRADDYYLLRATCRKLDCSMHKLLRLLIASWFKSISEEAFTINPVSEELKKSLEINRKSRYRVVPEAW